MRALGGLLGAHASLSKIAVQHTAARARVGYCMATAAAPSANAPIQLLNLQGTTLSEPALIELCDALGERGSRGPTELNLEGCMRRSPAALPALWRLISHAACSLTALNVGFNALDAGAEVRRARAALTSPACPHHHRHCFCRRRDRRRRCPSHRIHSRRCASSPARQRSGLQALVRTLPCASQLGVALAANASHGGRLSELDLGSNDLGGEHVDSGVGALLSPFSSPAAAAALPPRPAPSSPPSAATSKEGSPSPSRNASPPRTAASPSRTAASPSARSPAARAAVAPPGPRAGGTPLAGVAVGCCVCTLDLSYMNIGPRGAHALAAMLLTEGCGVTSLRLDGCGLGADGAALLAAALGDVVRGAPLTLLRLEYNSIGVAGVKALAAALPARPSLAALFVGCNGLGEAGARALAGAASICEHLRTLDVGDNDLSERALRALLEGVRSQQTLTALDVSNNRFGDGGASALAQELRTNPALLHVRAAGNEIGRAGGAELASALGASRALLDVTHNYAMEYADLMAIKLSNNRRATSTPPSTLDGGKREE
jgi:Ran GTPase-activating protein (RanGAP) involved in mRNA processing and transport